MTTTLTFIFQACPALARDNGNLVYAQRRDGGQVYLGSITRDTRGKWHPERVKTPGFETQEQAGAWLAQRRGIKAVDVAL